MSASFETMHDAEQEVFLRVMSNIDPPTRIKEVSDLMLKAARLLVPDEDSGNMALAFLSASLRVLNGVLKPGTEETMIELLTSTIQDFFRDEVED